jgi:hypothetical protein
VTVRGSAAADAVPGLFEIANQALFFDLFLERRRANKIDEALSAVAPEQNHE